MFAKNVVVFCDVRDVIRQQVVTKVREKEDTNPYSSWIYNEYTEVTYEYTVLKDTKAIAIINDTKNKHFGKDILVIIGPREAKLYQANRLVGDDTTSELYDVGLIEYFGASKWGKDTVIKFSDVLRESGKYHPVSRDEELLLEIKEIKQRSKEAAWQLEKERKTREEKARKEEEMRQRELKQKKNIADNYNKKFGKW